MYPDMRLHECKVFPGSTLLHWCCLAVSVLPRAPDDASLCPPSMPVQLQPKPAQKPNLKYYCHQHADSPRPGGLCRGRRLGASYTVPEKVNVGKEAVSRYTRMIAAGAWVAQGHSPPSRHATLDAVIATRR